MRRLLAVLLPAMAMGLQAPTPNVSDILYYGEAVGYTNAVDGKPLKHRGEYFEVVAPALTLKYGQVNYHPLEAKFPDEIIQHFDGKPIAITGFETQVTRMDEDTGKEVAVPCSDLYNHHWNLFLASSKRGYSVEEYAHLSSEGGCAPSPYGAPTAPAGPPSPGAIPVRQVLSEANGNEHRGTFHGTPKGYAQLLDSPATLALLHMSINTRNPNGHGLDPRGAPQPKNSVSLLQGADDGFSGILECPCTTRRNISLEDGTIDGKKWSNLCIPGGPLNVSNNTICRFEEYVKRGGLQCCQDMTVLLDADQPDYPESTYFHKLRIYYEEYDPTEISNAFRLHYVIEWGPNEYNIERCPTGTPPEHCINELSTDLVAADLFGGLSWPNDPSRLNCTYYEDVWCGQIADVEEAGGFFELLNMAFHQHSPALIDGELINVETNKTICKGVPTKGTKVGEPLNELGYGVGIPPCVWGSVEEGLPAAPVLHVSTPLRIVGRYNNTVPHYGVMSQWQGRGGLIKKSSKA